MGVVALLLAQQLPDMGTKVDETGQVHHVLDAFVRIPAFGFSNRLDVDDFADRAGPTRHDDDPIGQVHRFLDGVCDEQHRTRVLARQAHQFFLHAHAGLGIARANELAAAYGERFTPPASVVALAEAGGSYK